LVGSSQRLKNWHLMLLWLAHGQFKVTGWGIMFISSMVLRCVGSLKPGLSLVWTSYSRSDNHCRT